MLGFLVIAKETAYTKDTQKQEKIKLSLSVVKIIWIDYNKAIRNAHYINQGLLRSPLF